VASQAGRLQLGDGLVCLTGGLCQCEYIVQALGKALKTDIVASENGRYAGAIGAATFALNVRKKVAQ